MAFAPGRSDADGITVVEWLRDYTAVGAKTHSGIWRDLAVRKRKTEAEAQLMIMPKLAAQRYRDTCFEYAWPSDQGY